MLGISTWFWFRSALLGMVAIVATYGCTDVAACAPGAEKPCPCFGGVEGVQTCGDDGRFDVCECPGMEGVGGNGAGGASTSTGASTCGDGIQQTTEHCDNKASEFYCSIDCQRTETGGGGMSGAGSGGAGSGGAGG